MKIGPLILAGLAAGVLAVRWRRWPRRTRALVVAIAIGLAVWGSGAIQPPNLESLSRDVGAALGSYTYLAVGLLAFLETGAGIGLIAPGELAVVIGGVSAGQGHTDLLVMIAIVWACALAGDLTSYLLGRRLGRGFLLKHGAALKLTPERLERVETFLRRHGGKTIVVGRFIGLVRALAPFAAGSMNMPARRFIPAVFLAAGIWAATFTVLGYAFWQSFDEAEALAKQGTFALVGVVIAVTVLIIAYRNLRTKERRRELGRRLRTIPVAASLRSSDKSAKVGPRSPRSGRVSSQEPARR
jgi:membrane protein DedA with SNARE-associated domain